MANAGDTIRNPLTGERITFLQTTRDTNGELLRFEYLIPPGFSIPEHVHPRQEERHEILSGTLKGRVGGYERVYVEGQKLAGPADVPHAWRNPSDDEGLLMVSELRPALRFEPLIETAFVLAGDLKVGKMASFGHLLRIAVLLDESRDDFYPTRIPMAAWKAALAFNTVLARAGRSLGYDEGHPADGRGAQAGLLAAVAFAALVFALRRWGRRITLRG